MLLKLVTGRRLLLKNEVTSMLVLPPIKSINLSLFQTLNWLETFDSSNCVFDDLIKLIKLETLRVRSLFAVGSSCLMGACCCTRYIHWLQVWNLGWLITSQGTWLNFCKNYIRKNLSTASFPTETCLDLHSPVVVARGKRNNGKLLILKHFKIIICVMQSLIELTNLLVLLVLSLFVVGIIGAKWSFDSCDDGHLCTADPAWACDDGRCE